ncbi:MAG: AMP-binding protein [Actinobacteria bacterium]|nr:AMP-binding protein [Actinomycetota bacterium]
MPNFAEYPWRHGEATPERLAFRCGEDLWTYGRLRAGMAALAGDLRARGLGPGDRAVLIAPSVPEFAIACYGMQAAGVGVVAMNPLATAHEIGYVLEDAECSLAVVWAECLEAATEAAAARGIEVLLLVRGGVEDPLGPPLSAPHEAAADETALIVYTSGTTGRPKGAELTHGNLIASAEMHVEVLEATPEDVFATALPLVHVYGGVAIVATAMMVGAATVLFPRFRAKETLAAISAGRASVFAGVPTMYNAILHQATEERADLSRLRFCCSGGASLPEEVLRAFKERFGVVILEGYALTEVTSAATFNGLRRKRKVGFVGIPMPRTEVRVVDADDHEVDPGEVGEVVIRGPQVMKGYYGRPEVTAETIRDGWLHTGDLGSKDEEGDLRIVGRKKELIIRGGYNVYPSEVEQVLFDHPEVAEAAVVGVEDPHFGEEVAAAVVLESDAEVDAGALGEWAAERLMAYKVPRLFRFLDALPQGATGKIQKRGLEAGPFIDLRPARSLT